MRNEHAIKYEDKITMKELEYLVRKANRLGAIGHEVVHVFQTEDSEGFHVYFEVAAKPEPVKASDE
jgi:hypothetical protein